MAKLRSDPNKDLSLVQERLNQFFKEALYSGMGKDAEQGSAFVPPVDILETKDEVVLKAELPGVLKENIDIQIEGDVLVLKGERKFEKEVGHENFYRMECSYGTFQRAFTLPQSIKKDEIQAHFDRGVLEIRLPKEVKEDEKRIEIK
jgi:HSP20 family protein